MKWATKEIRWLKCKCEWKLADTRTDSNIQMKRHSSMARKGMRKCEQQKTTRRNMSYEWLNPFTCLRVMDGIMTLRHGIWNCSRTFFTQFILSLLYYIKNIMRRDMKCKFHLNLLDIKHMFVCQRIINWKWISNVTCGISNSHATLTSLIAYNTETQYFQS